MCSTLSVLLVLLNTVVGKAGKDELGRMWEICNTHTKFWSERSHFDYPHKLGDDSNLLNIQVLKRTQTQLFNA